MRRMRCADHQCAGWGVCLFVAAIAVLALPVFCAAAADGDASVRFTPDGFVILDGQPRLILGLYEFPKEQAVLEKAAASGVNLVCAGMDKGALDKLHALGMRGWIPLGGALALAEGDATGKANLEATVKGFKDHPALLCWEGPDEALWMEWYRCYKWITAEQPQQLMALIQKVSTDKSEKAPTPEKLAEWGKNLDKAVDCSYRGLWKESEALYDGLWQDLAGANPHPELHVTACIASARDLGDKLTRGWEVVWGQDKRHVFWQNHAPGNGLADLRRYNRFVHAAGCDIYPAPFNTGVMHGGTTPNVDITNVGEFTRYMRAGAPGKACWMVLQGFGWTDLQDEHNPKDPERGRRPTLGETRFMAYEAILNGANAILYWGTSCIAKDSSLWNDILKVCAELRAIEPAIVGVKAPAEPFVAGELNYTCFNGGDPKLMLRQVGEDWVLIALNEWRAGIAFEIGGLPLELEGRTLYRLYADEEHKVERGGFRDGIRPQGVHVYATSRRFEAK